MFKSVVLALITAGAASAVVLAAEGRPEHNHDMHMQHGNEAGAPPPEDSRMVVHYPEALRIHTLANMRDHLIALAEIQEALAAGKFEEAGSISEQRLGMTSLTLHGAHEVSQYMPKEMRAIGSEMHRSASRFAIAANDAAVGGDVRPALAELARVTRQCIACHGAYRVQ